MLDEYEFHADKAHDLTEKIDGIASATLGDNTMTGGVRFFALVLLNIAVVVLGFNAAMG